MKYNHLKILGYSIFIVLVSFLAVHAEEIKFARSPAPSPDGALLAFCYQGDLFTVDIRGGQATRHTVHPAYDDNPVWSWDGTRLLFTSDRSGYNDLYVADMVNGTPPVRLTFVSTGDYGSDWTPDGSCIVFTSMREHPFSRPSLFKIPVKGDTPASFIPVDGWGAKISPDNSKTAFVRNGSPWWRRGYKGSCNADIWVYDKAKSEFHQITSHTGDDRYPMWSGNSRALYYLSDRVGARNIFLYDFSDMSHTRITGFSEYMIGSPSISRDGAVIAFEYGDAIYTLSTNDNTLAKLSIHVLADYREPEQSFTTISRADQFALSPDGNEFIVISHGDLYGYRDEQERSAIRITNTGGREKSPRWFPEGDRIMFVSDRNGNYDLYTIKSSDKNNESLSVSMQFDVHQLTDHIKDETDPVISPDGKMIAFRRGQGSLVIMDPENGKEKILFDNWNLGSYRFSPDGNWIAFEREDEEFNSDIFIVPVDGSMEPVNISQHPDYDRNPLWGPYGKTLFFSSKRSRDSFDIWMVYLRKSDFEKTDEEFKESLEKNGKEKSDAKDDDEKEVPRIVIDTEQIYRRLRKVTSFEGDEYGVAVSPKELKLAFTANPEGETSLWVIDWDGENTENLVTRSIDAESVAWDSKGKSIYFLSSGTVRSVSVSGRKEKTHGFSAKTVIDRTEERVQVFEEAWRLIRDNFYDPGLHGADWELMKKRYFKLAVSASTDNDFYDAIRMMLGELNSSHVGIGKSSGGGEETGSLCVRYDPSYNGPGMKIAAVIPDGPADREDSRLEPGDVIISVNGQEIGPGINVHTRFINMVDERVLLQVYPSGKKSRKKEIIIRPVSFREHRNLMYREWVDTNTKYVDETTGSKLAYIHIRAMGHSNLELFERDLYAAAHGKQGLIIDVRDNHGGWITDMLMAIIDVRKHAYTVPRDGKPGYPQRRRPLYFWTKPVVTLCNERSYSNAEIFSHAFKTLKRGKLIGWPTFGGVISTGGTRLLDGSWLRLPFRGWYVYPTGVNMENNGAVPDIPVFIGPEQELQDRDPQLEKAIEVLMEEISINPDKE